MVGTCILPGSVGAPSRTRAFLLERDGAFSLLDIPGSTRSEALGINNRGQIVGSFRAANFQTLGFVSYRGQITVVDMTSQVPPTIIYRSQTFVQMPGPVTTKVVAINTRGDIVVWGSTSYRRSGGGGSFLQFTSKFIGTASQGK